MHPCPSAEDRPPHHLQKVRSVPRAISGTVRHYTLRNASSKASSVLALSTRSNRDRRVQSPALLLPFRNSVVGFDKWNTQKDVPAFSFGYLQSFGLTCPNTNARRLSGIRLWALVTGDTPQNMPSPHSALATMRVPTATVLSAKI